MGSFYDDWLGLWARSVDERRKARKVILPEELQWVKTRQDYRAALLVAPETGFRTLGGATLLAEIPRGWKTGRHRHGEEAMYILRGKGYSIVGDQRFDWEEGACLRIPFGAVHQHFNGGDAPVLYYAALAPHLEYFCSVARFEQLEDCGEVVSEPRGPEAAGTHDAQGRRIVLHRAAAPAWQRGEADLTVQDAFQQSLHPQMHIVQHETIIKLMSAYEDFRGDLVEITDIFVDRAKTSSQKHAHMEALLYVLQGEGYTVIDGEEFRWKPGAAIHIPGPQTVHQHFVTSDKESRMLRTHFGIRKYLQPIVKEVFPYQFFEQGKSLA